MRVPSIDQEYEILERLNFNQREATGQHWMTRMEIAHVKDKPLALHCVICGEPMLAQRRSKTTCSNRCRLRLSRFRRARKTLSKAELRKRDAVVSKRWRRATAKARAKERAEEKRRSKMSLEELTANIKANLAKMGAIKNATGDK